MIQVISQRTYSRTLFSSLCVLIVMLSLLPLSRTAAAAGTGGPGDALYLSLQPTLPFPSAPASLLIPAPNYIDVPAGAVLSIYLMRGGSVVSTSTLTFQRAFLTQFQPNFGFVASFVQSGSLPNTGEVLSGATINGGIADLTKVALEPATYQLLWTLSAGMMATPSVAIATGNPQNFVFVDLKLSAVSAAMLAGDQKPGSVLFFNRYTSNASNSTREDTTFNLTNTHPATAAYVRLFLVSATTCQTTELQLCLAAQQTVSFLMSDVDPGTKGYVIAVATNLQGEPIQFNWLTGNVIVKQPGGNITGSYASLMNAVAVAKRKDGNVPNTNGLAEMVFDDTNYDRLPAQIAFDGVPSQSGGSNATLLSFYRPITDLSGSVPNASVQVTGWGKNNQGQVISSTGNVSSACYSDIAMGTFRLQPTPISQLLPSGATAWFAASSNDLLPLLGTQFNSGEYNSGANARPLSFSAEYKIRIPVSAVTCPQ
ncbi:MAG: hypothetical protein ABI977_23075 [Acidobacteriota bacterium]